MLTDYANRLGLLLIGIIRTQLKKKELLCIVSYIQHLNLSS